jgi:hypothetical protein
MTIISAVLGENYIAVASDSMRTEWNEAENRYTVLEDKLPKIVSVPKFPGVISWCGYSGWGSDDLLPWFQERANQAPQMETAEEFASFLTTELHDNFEALGMVPGIALHFAAYEPRGTGNKLVPELFYIHTYNGAYDVAQGQKVLCQRHSYFTVTRSEPNAEHRDEQYRMAVLQRIRLGGSEAAPTGKRSYWKPANHVAVLGLSVGKRQP